MKRFLWIAGFVLLMIAIKGLKDNSPLRVETIKPLTNVSELEGMWRESEFKHERGFDSQGKTWIETTSGGFGMESSRQSGTYRLVRPGVLEVQMQGEAPVEWEVDFLNDILRMKPPRGEIVGYHRPSNPQYAPLQPSGK